MLTHMSLGLSITLIDFYGIPIENGKNSTYFQSSLTICQRSSTKWAFDDITSNDCVKHELIPCE
jgi:hypothetical protein